MVLNMDKVPFVFIIIPCRNKEKYLDCIEEKGIVEDAIHRFRFRDLFIRSIRIRFRSDVKIGAFKWRSRFFSHFCSG